MLLHKFNIYPGSKRGYYCTVFVWPTLKELRENSIQNVPQAWAYAGGTFRINKKGNTTRQFAHCHFSANRINSEIVAHECLHVALSFAARKRITLPEPDELGLRTVTEAEESICYPHGRMVAQVCDKFHELKLW